MGLFTKPQRTPMEVAVMEQIQEKGHPEPQAIDTKQIPESLEEYHTLLNETGAKHSMAFCDALLLQTLANLGISVYKYDEVMQYLESKCPKGLKVKWVRLAPRSDYENYRHPVPIEALRLIKQIQDAHPKSDKIYFNVSDYGVPNPDPFLSVYSGEGMYVIFAWDEPEFTTKHG